MKKPIVSFALTLLILPFTYLVNNSNVCCDIPFEAGWPFAFYGGSGGFLGKTSDKIILGGLLLDLIFWFIIFYISFIVFSRFKRIRSDKKSNLA